jgi:hypothetical protein
MFLSHPSRPSRTPLIGSTPGPAVVVAGLRTGRSRLSGAPPALRPPYPRSNSVRHPAPPQFATVVTAGPIVANSSAQRPSIRHAEATNADRGELLRPRTTSKRFPARPWPEFLDQVTLWRRTHAQLYINAVKTTARQQRCTAKPPRPHENVTVRDIGAFATTGPPPDRAGPTQLCQRRPVAWQAA